MGGLLRLGLHRFRRAAGPDPESASELGTSSLQVQSVRGRLRSWELQVILAPLIRIVAVCGALTVWAPTVMADRIDIGLAAQKFSGCYRLYLGERVPNVAYYKIAERFPIMADVQLQLNRAKESGFTSMVARVRYRDLAHWNVIRIAKLGETFPLLSMSDEDRDAHWFRQPVGPSFWFVHDGDGSLQLELAGRNQAYGHSGWRLTLQGPGRILRGIASRLTTLCTLGIREHRRRPPGYREEGEWPESVNVGATKMAACNQTPSGQEVAVEMALDPRAH